MCALIKVAKRKTGRKQKIELTADVEALLRKKQLTDQEIAERLNVSRHTVLRMRKKLGIIKPRGGARPGAGRPRAAAEEVPRPRLPRRRLRISDEALAAWCATVYEYEPHSAGRPARLVPRWRGRRLKDLPVVAAPLLPGQRG